MHDGYNAKSVKEVGDLTALVGEFGVRNKELHELLIQLKCSLNEISEITEAPAVKSHPDEERDEPASPSLLYRFDSELRKLKGNYNKLVELTNHVKKLV